MYGGGAEGNQYRQTDGIVDLSEGTVGKGKKEEEEDREKFNQKRKRGRKI